MAVFQTRGASSSGGGPVSSRRFSCLALICLLNTIKYSLVEVRNTQQAWVVGHAISSGETSLTRIVTFSSLWAKLFMRKETKVLILGLDNAGKVSRALLRETSLMNSQRSCIV
jgi:hypothetical protein